MYNPSSGYWEFPIDTTTLTDAEGTVTAMATDTSGRMSVVAGPVSFTVDNNAPTLSFASLSHGDIITDGAASVVLDADDESFGLSFGDVLLSIDGSIWTEVPVDETDAFVMEWDTSVVTDGGHTLTARATDAAGHMVEAEIAVVVDNTDPILDIITPTEGQYLEGVIVFQVATRDSQGITSVALAWGESDIVPATLNAQTNYYEYTLDTTTLVDGTYTLAVQVVDSSGRMTSAEAEFNIDNTVPSLVLDGPLPDTVLTGDANITISVEDDFLDVVQYRVDDLGWVDMEGGEAILDTTELSDGTHVITVRAVDNSGKTATTSAEIIVDNTAPDLSVASMPARGAHIAGEHVLAVHADDAIGIVGVVVAIDGGEPLPVFLNPETGFYEWTFDSAMLDATGGRIYGDGERTMIFTATDAAGHSTDLSHSLYVDNTGPELSELAPSRGTVKDRVIFRATVNDPSGVEEVLVRLDQGPWRSMTKQQDGTWTWEWETDVSDNVEDLPVYFKAIDSLGNSKEESVSITVDNFNWWWVALVVVLVILGVLFFMLWRWGYLPIRRGEGAEVPPEEEVEYELEEMLMGPEGTQLEDSVEEGEIQVALEEIRNE
jgi:hypothetical protein